MALTASQLAIVRNDANSKFVENAASTFEHTPLRKYVGNLTGIGQSLKSGWVGDVPRPVVRLPGDAPTERALKIYAHTITAKTWDSTILVEDEFMEDAEQTGNVGGLSDIGGNMGRSMAAEVLYRATDVLEAGTGTTLATDYEGLAFLRTDHAESGANQSNLITLTGVSVITAPTPTELEAAAKAIMVTVIAHKTDQGRPWDPDSTNLGFMYPTGFEGSAVNVFRASGNLGDRSVSSMGTRTDSGVTDGSMRGHDAFANPTMAGTADIFGLRAPKNGGGYPLIVNMRKRPDLIFRDRASKSDRAIELNAALWTSMARFEVGYAQWRGATRCRLTT